MKTLKNLTLFILTLILLASCSSDDDNQNGSQPIDQVYQDIVPEAFLQLIINTCDGTVIAEGSHPPTELLDKIFKNDSYLLCTTLDGDELGNDFNDLKIKISNFNPETFSCDFEAHSTSEDIISEKAYFLGDDNKFSVFARILGSIDDNPPAKFLYLATGEYTTYGIKNSRVYIQSIEVPIPDVYLPEGEYRSMGNDFENNENSIASFVDSF